MAEPTTKTWADGSGGGTPITAAELNRMEALMLKALGGSPILPPASPNAKDDEFDGTSSVTWSDTPTAPTSVSINGTVPQAMLISSSGQGSNHVGKVQSIPGAYPFTVTVRVNATRVCANFQKSGIVFAPSSATSSSTIYLFGVGYNSSNGGPVLTRWTGTYGGTFSSQSNQQAPVTGLQNVWLQVTANSASSFTSKWSPDGRVWVTHESAFNPGFTPASMGLSTCDESAATGLFSAFDFFRVT